jgi:hypothetical protein
MCCAVCCRYYWCSQQRLWCAGSAARCGASALCNTFLAASTSLTAACALCTNRRCAHAYLRQLRVRLCIQAIYKVYVCNWSYLRSDGTDAARARPFASWQPTLLQQHTASLAETPQLKGLFLWAHAAVLHCCRSSYCRLQSAQRSRLW